MASLAIHIRPGANPTSITKMILLIASEDHHFANSKELLDFAESEHLGSYAELHSVPSNMELIEKSNNGIHLSEKGRIFAKLRQDVQADILHFFMYTGWQKTKPRDFLPSWAYRKGCDKYWQEGSIELTVSYLDRQVEETINLAKHDFEQLNIGDYDEISFGHKSLQGLRDWLSVLNPKVLEGNTFNRRVFCAPELLLLAIGYVISSEGIAIDTDILLTHEKRDEICRICLLEPSALDRSIDWMMSIFSNVIAQGTSAGFYGRFVRLHKYPSLDDIVR